MSIKCQPSIDGDVDRLLIEVLIEGINRHTDSLSQMASVHIDPIDIYVADQNEIQVKMILT